MAIVILGSTLDTSIRTYNNMASTQCRLTHSCASVRNGARG